MEFIRSIQTALTGDCNYRCIMCGEPKLPGKYMSLEIWKTLVDSLKRWPRKVELAMAVRGEPLIHPQFPLLLKILKEANQEKDFLYQVYMDTNAFFLRGANAEALLDFSTGKTAGGSWPGFRLTVSLDAASTKKYSQIRRGGHLQVVKENVKNFLKERAARGLTQPKLNFQFIAMEENRAEVLDFLNYWKNVLESFNLEYTVSGHYPTSDRDNISFVELHVQNGKTSQKRARELHERACELAGVSPFPSQGGRSELNSGSEMKHSESEKQEKTARVSGGLQKDKSSRYPCAWPWYMIAVNWDGKVSPCCRDIHSKNVMGELAHEPLDRIISGERYREFRLAQIHGTADRYEVCRDCYDQLVREVTTVETIERYLASLNTARPEEKKSAHTEKNEQEKAVFNGKSDRSEKKVSASCDIPVEKVKNAREMDISLL